jgi:small nuclear ribonucleoprotein E
MKRVLIMVTSDESRLIQYQSIDSRLTRCFYFIVVIFYRHTLHFIRSSSQIFVNMSAQQKVQKVMVQPINLIFRFLQNKSTVSIWLYDQHHARIEGRIIGFDEFMNIVLDDAIEVNTKKQTRKEIGK